MQECKPSISLVQMQIRCLVVVEAEHTGFAAHNHAKSSALAVPVSARETALLPAAHTDNSVQVETAQMPCLRL